MDDCIENYIMALEVDPCLTDIRTRLGLALQDTGEETLAKEQFEEAIKNGDASAEAHSCFADIICKEGKIIEAMCEYRKAIQLSGFSDTQSMVALGELLMNYGRNKEALKMFQKAYDLGVQTPQIISNLSRLSENLNRRLDAIKYFRLLADGNFTDPVVLFETAKRSVESKIEEIFNPEGAVKITSNLAEKTEWKHPGILEVLADAHAKLGEFSRAAEVESLAIHALPEGNPLLKTMESKLEEFLIKAR